MNNFSKQLTPKNDIVFKKTFGTKGNEGILKDFLEAILDIEIESLELDSKWEMMNKKYNLDNYFEDIEIYII